MISVSGVRGIVGKGLTPSVVSRFALAFGTFVKGGKVVIGSDTRHSREVIRHSVVSGLLASGCNVVDIGICPTPTVLYNVKHLKTLGGIAITASHNPAEWNGLKFIGRGGIFLDGTQAKRLIAIYEKNRFHTVPWNRIGKVQKDNEAVKRHIDAVLSLPFLNITGLRKRKFRVAVDCVNGAASEVFPQFLERFGCDVIKVFCDGTGDFRRSPEPVGENLSVLGEKVRKNKADVGFATDADGDRLSIVGNDGIPFGEEYSLALAGRFYLSKLKGSVVTNLSTSRMIDTITKEFGVKLYRTKVGEANVVSKMKVTRAVFGGEGNGGVIVPKIHYTRDALSGIELILQYMLESGKTIKQLSSELEKMKIVKKKLKISKELNYGKIVKELPPGKINRTDGVRIDWKEGWIHIRKSGTEPIVRIIAEARRKKDALNLCNKVIKMIEQR